MGVSGYGAPQDHSGLSGNKVGDPHTQYSMVLVGLASARPVAGTAGVRAGTMYFATDTQTQTTYDGAVWTEPGLTPFEGDRDYVRLVADNVLSGRNSFAPDPKNGFPLQYEPAGTNLITNPSFEVDLAGWGQYVGGALAITRQTAGGLFGPAFARAPVATGANFHGIANVASRVPVVPGEVLTVSAWMKTSVAARPVRLYLRGVDAAGAEVGRDGEFLQTSSTVSWVRYSHTIVVPAGIATLQVMVINNGADNGAYDIDVDGVQVERNSVVTSYIDGAQGTGFAWTGTAHASTSTRAANTVARAVTDVATTNHVRNPRAANDLNSTTIVGGTVARVTDEGRFGTSFRVDVAAGTVLQGIATSSVPATPGQAWVGAATVRSPQGKKVGVQIRYLDVNGAELSPSPYNVYTTTSEYTRIIANPTAAVAPAGTTQVALRVLNESGVDQGAYTFFADMLQMEQASVGTSYADGSLGTGFAWTGTPHASTSTRAANTIIPAVVKQLPPYGLVADAPGRNLITNPSFEVDTNGWAITGAATLTRDTASASVGVGAASIAIPAGAVSHGIITPNNERVPAEAGETLTFSANIKTSVAAKTVAITVVAYDSAGTFLNFGVLNFTGTTSYARQSVTHVLPAATKSVRVEIRNNGADQGVFTIFADALLLERSAAATSYIDGSLGPGYTWEGTPHASPSRRLAGSRVLGSGRSHLGTVEVAELTLPQAKEAVINPAETTTSTAYADLATIGPVVPATIGPSGRALVLLSVFQRVNTAGATSFSGVAVSGATTRAASDNESVRLTSTAIDAGFGAARAMVLTGLNPGQNTFTAKYRVDSGTGLFGNRSLIVIPL